ncbi:MAG: thymidine phosphorylase [Anaerolineae bacterium]|jgi:pyrimidine-nucleoside phosphorylase|nr:thymidine phosphorylase [Anaerolineae bacterium]MBT4310022.1 thymidine phosphorylase [Anaerolineae bacterium]MBT4456747.1 thymidine phosphorylase [Anaerolineae bacterium]MBT6060851.1 thymidine phosphorylase [Anaerolineae bacterium]MBT6812878.1 thymidine phosphorylase [Anaerolineae bacterium]
MRTVDIITKKREKEELTKEEINFFVEGFAQGDIPDYQASAWAMAVLLNGMTPRETTDLTLAIANSGDTIDLSDVVDIAVDKHSSGGVGDKTTLVVLPIVATCGLPVGKMSGRGLGFTGGTLDKLEAIPGFSSDMTTEEFKKQLHDFGMVLSGQSADLAPADGKLYALRDVSGTVPSMPLIASSIMSKKIAAGAQVIVLDVKLGLGAFMATLEDARELAEHMVSIGELAGRKTVALLSDMNQPLGHAVGNALEVIEAIDALHGGGPADFREHCLHVSAHMLVLGEKAKDLEAARIMAENAIADGSAFATFRKLVIAQGGDTSYVDDPAKFPKAKLIETVNAPRGGSLSQIHARLIGEAAVALGAGRAKKGDPIDHAVGFIIHHKVGDIIKAGEPLFTIHANEPDLLAQAREEVLKAHVFSDTPVSPLPLFYT